MTTSRLKLYNAALLHIGEREAASLSDTGAFMTALDRAWDSGQVVTRWLELGLWNFATRTQLIDYESGIDPDFGYQYAFTKPSDWVRTAAVSANEYFDPPLTRYEDEGSYWWADVQELYVMYVSDDNSYGNDMSLWPETFVTFCELDLAVRIMKRATSLSTQEKQDLKADRQRALNDAKTKDAMNEPARFPPQGRWARSRGSRTTTSWRR